MLADLIQNILINWYLMLTNNNTRNNTLLVKFVELMWADFLEGESFWICC